MGSQGLLRRSDAGWGVIRGKRMVPNESDLDSAIAEGELAEKEHLPGTASGGVGEAWVKARPADGTSRVEAELSALQGCLEWERSKVSWDKSGSLPPCRDGGR